MTARSRTRAGQGVPGSAPDGPGAVTRAFLSSLASATDGPAAASVLAGHASESFLAKVGGRRHLARLLTNSAFGPLVGHERAELQPPERIDDAARVSFIVHGPGGDVAGYLLSLVWDASAAEADADAGTEGRWLVTGLVRRGANTG